MISLFFKMHFCYSEESIFRRNDLGSFLEIFFFSALFFFSWENLSYSIHILFTVVEYLLSFLLFLFLVPGLLWKTLFLNVKMETKGGMKLCSWMVVSWEYIFLTLSWNSLSYCSYCIYTVIVH